MTNLSKQKISLPPWKLISACFFFSMLIMTSVATNAQGQGTADTMQPNAKGRIKSFFEKKIQPDTSYAQRIKIFFIPLFSPSEYKIFEEDPTGLFTKTGARLSLNARYTLQREHDVRYRNTHLISANYGFLRTSANVGYIGRFGHAIGPFDFVIKARYDLRGVLNYFGTGNETTDSNTILNYYRTITTRFYGGVGLSTRISQHQGFDVSVFYRNVRVKDNPGHFTAMDHGIDSSLFSNNQFSGAEAAYHARNVNNEKFPTAGFDFVLAADVVQNLKQTNRRFTNVASSFSVYVPLGRSFSVASRVGGAALSGDADFYDLNKLGGYVNLRGYARERFAGKTSFYNNNEVRWVTNTNNHFFDGQLGLLAFYDDGRVWQPFEKSDSWHRGYGAGIIVIPYGKVALTGTYCTSKDGIFIQLKAGMLF